MPSNSILQEQTPCSSNFSAGGTQEAFFLIPSSPGKTFPEAASEILSRLESALSEIGSSHENTVFSRVYFSDITRQANSFYATKLYREISHGAVSCMGQPPLEGGLLSLFCYQIVPSRRNVSRKLLLPETGAKGSGLFLEGNYGMLWFVERGKDGLGKIAEQTKRSFLSSQEALRLCGMNWAEHVLRTWIFIDDIDHQYDEMVKTRIAYFSGQGLTAGSRFPASTGIGAVLPGTGVHVRMELLGMKGFSEGQVRAMAAADRMPPAISYGVSFERGLKVEFGDRIHYHLSGTASIGLRGEILHPADVERQMEQALENVEGLLATEGAQLSHLAYLLVYLREAASAPKVREVLRRRLPAHVPTLLLEGAVCRPGWLVEIEGLGIQATQSRFRPFL